MTLGFLIAVPVFGMFFHEFGHALACQVFGLRIVSWSPTEVVHGISSNPSVNIAVGFAGGMAQAVACFAMLLATGSFFGSWLFHSDSIERRLEVWSVSIGLDLAFLMVGFIGLVTAFWEGFFSESYDYFSGNTLVWATVALVAGLVAFLILYKAFPAPTESDGLSSSSRRD